MTVFAKKTMNLAVSDKVQYQIGKLQSALGNPHDLMMLRAKTADFEQDDIYIGLPGADLLAAFPGFEQVDRGSLPDFLATGVVREDGFEEHFPDIHRKRRSRRS